MSYTNKSYLSDTPLARYWRLIARLWLQCGICGALTTELSQSCSKQSICFSLFHKTYLDIIMHENLWRLPEKLFSNITVKFFVRTLHGANCWHYTTGTSVSDFRLRDVEGLLDFSHEVIFLFFCFTRYSLGLQPRHQRDRVHFRKLVKMKLQ